MSGIRPSKLIPASLLENEQFRTSLGIIVLCKGAYDLTHAGHIESFWAASQLGDTVIVALATDDSVRSRKGSSRPILSFRERAIILSAMSYISYIVEYDDASPFNIIKCIRPSKFCATTFTSLTEAEQRYVVAGGTQLVLLERPAERSTSEIVAGMLQRRIK